MHKPADPVAAVRVPQEPPALKTDAIWKLLNEADDHQMTWSTAAWRQWFVQIVDAVSGLENVYAREVEAAPLVAPALQKGCINCGETENGGYQTEEAGPFCGECWTLLEAHFIRPYLAHAFVDGVPPEDAGFCRECGEGQAHAVHQSAAPLVAPAGVPERSMDERYHELLYAVGNKYRGESRHDTALRYIRQAETAISQACGDVPDPEVSR